MKCWLIQGHTGRFGLIISQDRSHHVQDASYTPKTPKTPAKNQKSGIWGFRGLTPYFALLALKGLLRCGGAR